jgi:hypothetical protein
MALVDPVFVDGDTSSGNMSIHIPKTLDQQYVVVELKHRLVALACLLYTRARKVCTASVRVCVCVHMRMCMRE